MTKTLHLGCGENIREDAHNVDIIDLDGVDEVVDLAVFPWPWADNSWDKIIAEHVFEHIANVERALREAARILKPGGTLEVVMPVGMNAIADPDHKHVWVWDTPEYYCGKRHWDVDVGLEVDQRDVDIHAHFSGVLNKLYGGVLALLDLLQDDGRWQFDMPVSSGNFKTVFKKPTKPSGGIERGVQDDC